MAYYPCSVFLLVSVLFTTGKWQAVALFDEESGFPPFPGPELEFGVAPAPAPEALQADVPVASTKYPFVVFLTTSSGRYLCGGVLVGGRAVLTVASCVLDLPPPQVVVGCIDNTQTTCLDFQVIAAREVVFHPSFLQNGIPNLAIVKLDSYAYVTPKNIPNRRFKIPEGAILDMFGWGRSASSSGNAQILQNAELSYLPKGMCALALRRIVSKHEICMGGEGSGSCDGSDGGPILWNGRLVGLIGRSHVCRQIGQLDVHINILPYIKWIRRTSRD